VAQAGLFDDAGDFAGDPRQELARLRDRARRLERNLLWLLKKLAYEVRSCERCPQRVYMVLIDGSAMPLNEDGTPHWATCPHADAFRKKTAIRESGQ
jgi:hypothetical protein